MFRAGHDEINLAAAASRCSTLGLWWSKNRLLTTIAYRLNGRTTYALEGSIFVAGAAVQWLRDGIEVGDSKHSGELAAKADETQKPIWFRPLSDLGRRTGMRRRAARSSG